ncbi:hypothetical protein N2152v2_004125 [Parachlorella kessleri]
MKREWIRKVLKAGGDPHAYSKEFFLNYCLPNPDQRAQCNVQLLACGKKAYVVEWETPEIFETHLMEIAVQRDESNLITCTTCKMPHNEMVLGMCWHLNIVQFRMPDLFGGRRTYEDPSVSKMS